MPKSPCNIVLIKAKFSERDTQPGSARTEPTSLVNLDVLIPVFDSDTGALLHDL